MTVDGIDTHRTDGIRHGIQDKKHVIVKSSRYVRVPFAANFERPRQRFLFDVTKNRYICFWSVIQWQKMERRRRCQGLECTCRGKLFIPVDVANLLPRLDRAKSHSVTHAGNKRIYIAFERRNIHMGKQRCHKKRQQPGSNFEQLIHWRVFLFLFLATQRTTTTQTNRIPAAAIIKNLGVTPLSTISPAIGISSRLIKSAKFFG